MFVNRISILQQQCLHCTTKTTVVAESPTRASCSWVLSHNRIMPSRRASQKDLATTRILLRVNVHEAINKHHCTSLPAFIPSVPAASLIATMNKAVLILALVAAAFVATEGESQMHQQCLRSVPVCRMRSRSVNSATTGHHGNPARVTPSAACCRAGLSLRPFVYNAAASGI
jgi:hypothetical protein